MVLAGLLMLMHAGLVGADGLIVVPHPWHQPHPMPRPPYGPPVPAPPTAFPLEVMYHRVQVTIDELVATTQIEQSFFNPTQSRLEGFYLFPVPPGAVLKDFTMLINGQKVQAELLEAGKARQIYEDIVRTMRDPALLEYSEQGLFKVRIFPIEPRSEKQVSISYREVLESEFDTIEYRYPLNTEKFSAKPLNEVSLEVRIKNSRSIGTIYSPSHEIDIVRPSEREARISFEQKQTKPDTDFRLYFTLSASDVAMTLLTYQDEPDQGFFFLNISPSFSSGQSTLTAKDITFVIDVSGSMAGQKLDQAKKALLYCVDNLSVGDRFQIIRFSTEATTLFQQLTGFTDESRGQAQRFIADLRPIGGTGIEEALERALIKREDDRRPHLVIFITDGKPTIGETNEDTLITKIKRMNDAHTRIFTFGIGDDINTHLLDKITEETRASRTYISPSEDIELKISHFYDRVQSPVLTGLSLEPAGPVRFEHCYPRDLPDLFKGSAITVFGKYRGQGKSLLTLKGMLEGKPRSFELEGRFVKNETQHDFIPALWATRRIGHILDLIRLHGQEKELIDEVTELARTYGIVTPYTSYLIMEDETVRTANHLLPQELQTLGWINTRDREEVDALKSEYSGLKTKSGRSSVQASTELEALNQAMARPGMTQGGERHAFTRIDGSSTTLTEQVKYIQGKAMYQNGNFWVDARLQDRSQRQKISLHFASPEYFALLQQKPEAAQFLALGQNVRFLLDDICYEITE